VSSSCLFKEAIIPKLTALPLVSIGSSRKTALLGLARDSDVLLKSNASNFILLEDWFFV